MRDVIVSLIIVGLLPACYRRPFVGLAVFSWLAYMRVQDLTWGFARDIRWSYYVAIVMFAGFMMSKERRRFFVPDPRCWIMLTLAALIGIGVLFSVDPSLYQFNRYLEFVKIVGIALFTTAVVTTRERLRVMVWIIALSLGFYGVKSGLWGLVNLGRVQILRGPGGMLADNNDLSMALAMAVPMLFHLGWTERNPALRRAFWFCLPLTIVTIGLTHSRGGFLSVSVAIAALVWRSRNRLQGILVGVLMGLAALVLAPDSYKDRLRTIGEYQTEGSAQGRIRAWGIATNMALDNPVLGVGFGKFRQHYMEYNPRPNAKELAGTAIIVAHSSYFQIWAECGTPALLLYFGLIFLSFRTCWRIRKEAARRYYSSWILNYAVMFEASLAAFLVGSTFLNRAHFDLFYHWVALILVFGNLARQEMRDELRYPERTGMRGEIRSVRPTGFGSQRGFSPDPLPGGA